jgi:hypothetical protein
MVLGLSYSLPVAGDERQDVASNHGSIVAIFPPVLAVRYDTPLGRVRSS